MSGRRFRPPARGHRAARGARGESLIEVLLALWLVAALSLELARVEIQQLRLRQALDLRLRAAFVLDTFAETRRAVGEDGAAIDLAARMADTLPEGRIAAIALDGGAIRVEASWRGATPGGQSAAAACTAAGAGRDCLAIVLIDRPAEPDVPDTTEALTAPAPTAKVLTAPATSVASPALPTSRAPSRSRARAAGHSLLELLIAAVLGGMVVTTALSVYQMRRDGQARRVDDARLRLDGQAAIDLLRAYGRLAGYGLSFAAGTSRALPAIVNCPAGASPGPVCLTSVPGSDGLVMRYRADPASASEGAESRRLLDCGGYLLSSRGTVTAARIAVRKDANYGLLRLHCHGPGGGSDPLVEGVERLRIRYWLPGAREPLAAQALGTHTRSVRGMEFCVTVRGHVRRPRGAAPGSGYRDCDGRWRPAAQDGYLRRTFTATVALRNAATAQGDARDMRTPTGAS
ncbi:hypothetical protein OVY01_10540 [Robbsia sp. Bb-Pol-6]|uniref:Prepilin-type N-terminal cleavage/methylation domain-containing protein n=1 Tax=Robbsia betulipollinis TaxID=2981849 RepID=A0ABT3ZMW4_9BURK|nr:hypothetical protein [Robbsia betulipollinis]MCY0387662.1 hypothetical protein [Robbsia betulipollinis]